MKNELIKDLSDSNPFLEEFERLQAENIKMRLILQENEIEEFISAFNDVENICLSQIARLKIRSEEDLFTTDEAKTLETLQKILKSEREKNKKEKKKKEREVTLEDLQKVANNDE